MGRFCYAADMTDKLSVAARFKQLTQLSFPKHFPIIQFPNLPLIIAIAAGETSHVTHGWVHGVTAGVSYIAMIVWAYEEVVDGVNWFRLVLGLAYLAITIDRIARALQL